MLSIELCNIGRTKISEVGTEQWQDFLHHVLWRNELLNGGGTFTFRLFRT